MGSPSISSLGRFSNRFCSLLNIGILFPRGNGVGGVLSARACKRHDRLRPIPKTKGHVADTRALSDLADRHARVKEALTEKSGYKVSFSPRRTGRRTVL